MEPSYEVSAPLSALKELLHGPEGFKAVELGGIYILSPATLSKLISASVKELELELLHCFLLLCSKRLPMLHVVCLRRTWVCYTKPLLQSPI